MKQHPPKLAAILLFLLLPVLVLSAEPPARTTISYITADGFYLSAGSGDGLAIGDTVRVVREAETVAIAVVSFTSESSASCQLVEGNLDEIAVGDAVLFTAAEATLEPTGESPVVSPEPVAVGGGSTGRGGLVAERRPEMGIRGRIGLQMRYQTDAESGHDVFEPGVSARLRMSDLFGTALKFEVRGRSRYTMRDRDVPVDLEDRWYNRVYEASLQYDDPASPLGYRVGRVYAGAVSGIGVFDGAYADYDVAESWTVGAFGGLRPDPSTSQISSDDIKTGVFVQHSRGDWSTQRIDASLAFAGSYHQGEIDEEFLYQQVRYSLGRTLSLYESSELGVNRGWRQDAAGSSLELNNILLSARWSPVDNLSIDAGYDNRRILRTWETRDTPDSLFDDSVREGWRLGTNIRLTQDLRFSVQGNYRTREGGTDETVTGHMSLSHRDLFESGWAGNLRLAYFNNRYSTGYQPSVMVSSYLTRNLRLVFETGARLYEYDLEKTTYTDYWVRPGVSLNIGRHWYGQLYNELTTGDLQQTNRTFLELGVRF